MKRRAFTLVELLVVLSIIALLLGILLPALGKARRGAQAVICKSNLHNLSLTLSLYASDNRNKLTPDWWSMSYLAQSSLDEVFSKVMWHYCAQGYWKDPKVMFCPMATRVASVDGTTPDPRANSGQEGFPEWGHTEWAWYTPWAPPLKATGKPCMSSYGVNDWASTPYRSNSDDQSAANKKAWGTIIQKNATNIPMAFDSAWYSIMPEDTTRINPNPLSKYHSPYSLGPATLPRHKDGVNMVFLDGSGRRVGIRELWTLQWHKTFDTQNKLTKPDYTWPSWVAKLRK